MSEDNCDCGDDDAAAEVAGTEGSVESVLGVEMEPRLEISEDGLGRDEGSEVKESLKLLVDGVKEGTLVRVSGEVSLFGSVGGGVGIEGITIGESDSTGMVTTPNCEFETVAGSVGTVNCAAVDPFSRTTWITVITTVVGASGGAWRGCMAASLEFRDSSCGSQAFESSCRLSSASLYLFVISSWTPNSSFLLFLITSDITLGGFQCRCPWRWWTILTQ